MQAAIEPTSSPRRSVPLIGDFLRFSPTRVWAISSVSFAESIRRRVLWITPLAILGIIIVSQLQKPVDAADAIRQTTKIALFATGLVVTMATIILACTNLPKEIDNRVIYTIVTKPTTRLEIILGKILGFTRVAGAILLIMGLFTLAYLHLRAWNMRREIAQQLESGLVDPIHRGTFEHYAKVGLLAANDYHNARRLSIYARLSPPGETLHWISGASEMDVLVPFEVTPMDLAPPGGAPGSAGLVVLVHARTTQRALTTAEAAEEPEESEPPATAPAALGPFLPTTAAATAPATPPMPRRATPQILVQALDRNRFSLINTNAINSGHPVTLPTDPSRPAEAFIAPEAAATLATAGRFYISITGVTRGTEYGIGEAPVSLLVPGTSNLIGPAKNEAGEPMAPVFRGRSGTRGQQLRAAVNDQGPVAVFEFRNAFTAASDEIPFELRVGIERSGDSEEDVLTRAAVQVRDVHTGELSSPVYVEPENNRPSYFSLPRSPSFAGGDFDLVVRSVTPGHYLNLTQSSVLTVAERQSFAWNLFKSLLIMWLMALLVIIVSVFCSTFLSWPIAVVLTVVILLGHWGVQQIGDLNAPGIGNMIATDFGFRDHAKARVVSESVEALSRFLNLISKVLPDISRFAATENLERGEAVPPERLWDALRVIGAFGVPMILLAYIFLKNKEVAP